MSEWVTYPCADASWFGAEPLATEDTDLNFDLSEERAFSLQVTGDFSGHAQVRGTLAANLGTPFSGDVLGFQFDDVTDNSAAAFWITTDGDPSLNFDLQNGNEVHTWYDRSSGGRHLTWVNDPTHTPIRLIGDAVHFLDSYLEFAPGQGDLLVGEGAYTVFAVIRRHVTDWWAQYILWLSNGTDTDGYRLQLDTGYLRVLMERVGWSDCDNDQDLRLDGSHHTERTMYGVSSNLTNDETTLKTRDGNHQADTSNWNCEGRTFLASQTSVEGRLGGKPDGNDPAENWSFEGEICEIIIFPYAMDELELTRYEGALAWKWGIQDRLPEDHSYKFSPPFVGNVVGAIDGQIPSVTGSGIGGTQVYGPARGFFDIEVSGEFAGSAAIGGPLSGSIPPPTGTIYAQAAVVGALDAPLDFLSGAFEGFLPARGELDGTLAALTGSFLGRAAVGGDVVGAVPLPTLRAYGYGQVRGVLFGRFDLSMSGSFIYTPPAEGPLQGAVPPLSGQFIGTFKNVIREGVVTSDRLRATLGLRCSGQLDTTARCQPSLELTISWADALDVRALVQYLAQGGLRDTIAVTDTLTPQAYRFAFLATAVRMDPVLAATLEITGTLADHVLTEDRLSLLWRLLATTSVELADAFTADPKRLARIASTVSLALSQTPQLEITARLDDDVALRDALAFLARITFGSQFTALDQLSESDLARLARLADTVTLATRHTATLELTVQLFELATLLATVDTRHVLHLSDGLSLVDEAVANWFMTLAQSDVLSVIDRLSSSLVFLGKTASAVQLMDSADVSLTVLLRASDVVAFVGHLPLGDGDYEAWVLNSDSLGVTEYTNFPFNSLASTPRGHFGLTDTGLYELTGDTDDGDPIEALLKTGDLTLGTTDHKRVERAYLYLTSSDDIYLKTTSTHRGQRNEAWYRVNYRSDAQDGQTRRVRFGKGLRGTTWAFELSNIDGGDFDLRGAEILPVKLTRKI